MISNLALRNISLLSLEKYHSLQAQEKRYLDAGFSKVQSSDLFEIWKSLDLQEKQRLAKLEILDEIEEFQQLLNHYCIIVAKK
jgi:[phosphatase 2A protein]-leucine-carboxy methyltransferase